MERTNEFEEPGGNYPDQGGASTDEDAMPAQEEPSHVASGVGVVDGVPIGESVQTEPVMDHDEVNDLDKIAGIVVQTRADVGTEGQDRIAAVLTQRLDDAGITLSDDEIADLARQVASGQSEGAAPA